MAIHNIRKGLDLPITGAPRQEIDSATLPGSVAIMAADFVGMKPRLLVEEGATVKRGQQLFEDRKQPGVFFTSPGAGTLKAVNRGAKRALQSVVIELNENERTGKSGAEDHVEFSNYKGGDVDKLSGDEVKSLLVESGMWTALRARPFSRVPSPESTARAIFVTAADSNPLTASPDTIIKEREADLECGLKALSKLTEGTTYLCRAAGSAVSGGNSPAKIEDFQGKHPYGTAGLHIHTLAPVTRETPVWHVGYQDVLAIGALFSTGKLNMERVVALGGPAVKNPRLLRTRMGATTESLTNGELNDGDNRVIAGSVLSGRTAMGDIHGYIGRYHNQVSALVEGREREFLGWLGPGFNKFSVIPTFLSKLTGKSDFALSTSTGGSARAMVPIGLYEKVMPLDLMPTFLLRALAVGDLERAEQLGALELDEEDLALCTFVCPGKYNYGSLLRAALTQIEKEG